MMHFMLTLSEHVAVIGGRYVDPERYLKDHRDYKPEMICRTGDGHAKGTRERSQVTCPDCNAHFIAQKPEAVCMNAWRNDGEGNQNYCDPSDQPHGWSVYTRHENEEGGLFDLSGEMDFATHGAALKEAERRARILRVELREY